MGNVLIVVLVGIVVWIILAYAHVGFAYDSMIWFGNTFFGK